MKRIKVLCLPMHTYLAFNAVEPIVIYCWVDRFMCCKADFFKCSKDKIMLHIHEIHRISEVQNKKYKIRHILF